MEELGEDLLRGNCVRLPTPLDEPHGGVLSVAASQVLSGGHRNAAGPMSVAAMAQTMRSVAAAKSWERSIL